MRHLLILISIVISLSLNSCFIEDGEEEELQFSEDTEEKEPKTWAEVVGNLNTLD